MSNVHGFSLLCFGFYSVYMRVSTTQGCEFCCDTQWDRVLTEADGAFDVESRRYIRLPLPTLRVATCFALYQYLSQLFRVYCFCFCCSGKSAGLTTARS